ncbi:translocation/assembly module TamB domain-containing protein [Jiella marina]|uniref:translocation/assembly module TamB domain-containing protein n=1 Tax=Jiella sp. LLJ827 TaxID=2917712 RepID=UPI0021015534|nr:translocation/assembly module TamB domain-containing protein [Jiella sp. LLJ827]MCQ0988641.1 translocation/assembly module TamB domain-containing protein [Jiella sp. LLJ827]
MTRERLAALLCTFFLAIVALAAPTRSASAQEFIANQIENLISTDTMQVEIEGLSGAISGEVRIERLTVSDPQGVFLTASELAMDWSPLALVRSNVSIENLSAGQIVLERLPGGQSASEDSEGGGFSLPSITADIEQIRIEEFILGEAIAGTRARLRANASLTLEDDPTAISAQANIERLDQPGQVALDIAFAPDDNRLTVDIEASEPEGGLVATLLGIPGAPPVELTVNGSGPLSGFMANGALSVAGEQAATLTARVDRADEGYRASLSLNVAAQRFVPDAYARYVEGGATLDAQLLIRNDGSYVIEQGTLASQAIEVSASGTIDPSGPGNDLTLRLASPDGQPIAFSFGSGEDAPALSITSVEAALQGALSAATLEATTNLPQASFGDYGLDTIGARLQSDGFDLLGLSGPFALSATAESATAPDGVADRFLDGSLRIEGNGTLGPDQVELASATIQTGTATAEASGTAALNFSTFDLTLDSEFQTTALSAALTPIAGQNLSVSGQFARTEDGALNASNLSVTGDQLSIQGSAGLSGETVSADISGRLANVSSFSSALSGGASFSLTANGPLDRPDVNLTVDGNSLSINGRELANLTVEATGTLDPGSPTGSVSISGVVDGEELSGSADLATLDNGTRRISDLSIGLGSNRITGDLTLSENFLPEGTLDVSLDQLAALAALGGVTASGDVTGTIGFDVESDGTPVAALDLSGSSVTVSGNTLAGAEIDLTLRDYLGIPRPDGTVTAQSIEAAGVSIADLEVALSPENDTTAVRATARANGVPVTLAGTVAFEPNETLIALETLSADIPDAALSLTEPARLRIMDGTTTLSDLVVAIGEGTLRASGSAGETLDFSASLEQVPAALANLVLPDLSLAGTISGTADASGQPSDPNARFDLRMSQIVASRSNGVATPPVDGTIAGRYDGGTVTLQRAQLDLGGGSLSAMGTIGEELALSLRLNAAPVALANAFVEGLDASGTLSGRAEVTGSTANPNATFSLNGDDITAQAITEAGIAPLTLDASGSYEEGTLTLENAAIDVGSGSLTASGTIGEELDVSVRASNLPVGLVNGFVPDIEAEGVISGTATATGSISDPEADFDITGSGITTRQIARSGTAPLDLRLAGSYAEGTATIETGVVNVGAGSLRISGQVGQTLDVTAELNRLPVGLVNGFVDGLNAEGTLSGSARASGPLADPTATFDLSGSGITTEDIAAGGIAPLSLEAAGSLEDGTVRLETARVIVGDGSLRASGTVGQSLDLDLSIEELPVGLANGFVEGLNAEGTISGTGQATGSLSEPQATFELTGSGITTDQIARSGVAPLTLDVAGSYADGTARIETAELEVGTGSLTASGTVGETLDLSLLLNELPVGLANGFVDGLGARGTVSGNATATGSLSDPVAEFSLSGTGITTADVARSGVAPLTLDVAGTYRDGTVNLANAEVAVGNGSLTANGTIGQSLDIDVTLDQLPVGLANGFVDGLGARGTISGTASATGSLSSPNASFDLAARDVSVAQSRAAGAPSLSADLEGSYQNGSVDLRQAVVNVGGGTIQVTGSASPNDLNLTAEIRNLPASIASAAAGGLAPQGTINGTARASGSPSNPQVRYDLNASGVSLQQTRDAGVGALSIDTSGQYQGNRVTTDTQLSGNGVALSVNGSVGLSGTPTLDLSVDGTAPLSLANRILAEGGRSIEGTARIDARLSGPATQPNVNGTVSVDGARLVDANYNIALNGITTTIALNGQSATIQSFTAQLSSGGSLSVGGTVGLNGQFPADLSIQLDSARYNDGELIAARLSSDLTLTGPLLGTPTLAGTINAEEIDIIVPENLPSSLARIDVTHRNARPAVYEQQQELFPDRGRGSAGGGGVNLDITFNAPNEVFVRGRGLDVELGGRIRITGSSANPSIVGGLDLIRGRFQILARRLEFQRGRLTFTGDLIPTLDLEATSDVEDVTVYVTITGPATDPSIDFSSNPALPQEEVLARLIFGQGTSDLSPLQIAQLAEAAATLAGVGGSTGLLDNLRSQLGVDDLDITTTEDGQTAVGVGKYLNDNTYLGVDSTGRVSLDLKLGGGVKARGAVNAEGNGEVGIFYEGEF